MTCKYFQQKYFCAVTCLIWRFSSVRWFSTWIEYKWCRWPAENVAGHSVVVNCFCWTNVQFYGKIRISWWKGLYNMLHINCLSEKKSVMYKPLGSAAQECCRLYMCVSRMRAELRPAELTWLDFCAVMIWYELSENLWASEVTPFKGSGRPEPMNCVVLEMS